MAGKNHYDIVIVGAGPAGLMAAIAASEAGARTLVIDKGNKPGRKLGISGGGRCNVTNAADLDTLIRHLPGNGRFLYSALSRFGSREIIAFFEGLGIRLKEEDRGRMFPVTDKAKTVVDALVAEVKRRGAELRLQTPVRRILYENGAAVGVELTTDEVIRSRAVILATGGKSVPQTGSTGDGYPWAKQAGHTVTELFPTEVPLLSEEPYIKSRELQGLSLRDVGLTVWNGKGKPAITHVGDLLFTHFGLSGPIALRCSQFVVKELRGSRKAESGRTSPNEGAGEASGSTPSVRLTLDLFPNKTRDEVNREFLKLSEAEPKKAIKNVLRGSLPERLIPLLLGQTGLAGDTTYANLPRQTLSDLATLAKAFPIAVTGTLSLEEAFVTGGGIHLKEINPSTMESKLTAGLYFCGEILDVHGYTGGYNITAAFSSGFAAGSAAAERSCEDRT
ncbi:BaiN/RdsA family NAD(P)/FAD-dependent oxidoreductase [Gorillibacterium timonense]|uniref:NAD(P)/FAD-dependent oxidoreductase n=1 Tax=Gorillibacterium timonense TaxID=1689269 RepID=UPI00071CBFBB|nr:NAD(P)/FAD-dependent oxidoreductase [Gorillibacterium timonense]